MTLARNTVISDLRHHHHADRTELLDRNGIQFCTADAFLYADRAGPNGQGCYTKQ